MLLFTVCFLRLYIHIGHAYIQEGRNEVNVLFNDARNTFYLSYMVKDHSDSERGNPLPALHGLLFPISSKGYFYIHHPTVMIARTTAFVT